MMINYLKFTVSALLATSCAALQLSDATKGDALSPPAISPPEAPCAWVFIDPEKESHEMNKCDVAVVFGSTQAWTITSICSGMTWAYSEWGDIEILAGPDVNESSACEIKYVNKKDGKDEKGTFEVNVHAAAQ